MSKKDSGQKSNLDLLKENMPKEIIEQIARPRHGSTTLAMGFGGPMFGDQNIELSPEEMIQLMAENAPTKPSDAAFNIWVQGLTAIKNEPEISAYVKNMDEDEKVKLSGGQHRYLPVHDDLSDIMDELSQHRTLFGLAMEDPGLMLGVHLGEDNKVEIDQKRLDAVKAAGFRVEVVKAEDEPFTFIDTGEYVIGLVDGS